MMMTMTGWRLTVTVAPLHPPVLPFPAEEEEEEEEEEE